MDRAWLVGAVVLALALVRISVTPRLSPDGTYYLKPRHQRPRPYSLRWVWPTQTLWHWEVLTLTALAGTAILVGERWGLGAALLFLGLPIVRTSIIFPVLTDAPALLCLTASVVFDQPALGLVGGLFNEKAPIFSAIATMSPIPLAGLIFPLARLRASAPPQPSDPLWLRHPVAEAWKLRGRWESPQNLLLPWGALLLGVSGMPPWGVALLLASYSQLLVAQDGARLYQWGFLALMPGIVALVPHELWAPLIVVHWMSPWRRTL